MRMINKPAIQFKNMRKRTCSVAYMLLVFGSIPELRDTSDTV